MWRTGQEAPRGHDKEDQRLDLSPKELILWTFVLMQQGSMTPPQDI
jgi:hypothetical protein